ncbi:hypothetical protein J2W32_003702 [Variovorax boronicumulans]|uniref:Uncharacterized protein n=1 Tax=Variovorax boronicumulans TaxID=436515 RepID=A0AAW8D1T5_9BURK|nr:hypothetical protein [Variovorax boronicumulans]MDP9895037.1 hypothetical protein [Variovorax boronicumulans]MDP9993978.1 hypothetical protein [Variovorax boronicumulans]MDQ0005159.1 hypothetical protein [Variovorax boronicumulans]MDQ0038530.1 hypothetical protein [Variovorax boronicumulans]MDQ0044694.1 hypothetical protein [Variovorax boronicumulans]
MIDLRHLRCFNAAAEELNFHRDVEQGFSRCPREVLAGEVKVMAAVQRFFIGFGVGADRKLSQ